MELKGSTNENYQLKLKEKREHIEDAIQNVSKLRKDLEENCRNVKLEVQKSIAQKIEHLHQREMQLLRQVDALIGHQSALLQMRLSHLYQALGSFKAWAELGNKVSKLPTLNEDDLECVSPCLIHYQADETLSLAIQTFGSLEAKGAPAKVFILPDEEGYGDGDHHVLHKTLQEENETKVTFPKLYGKLEDWLPKEASIQDLEYNSSCSSISDVSESIEMLSHLDLLENQEWLLPNNNGSKLCNCQNLGNIEIENLDSLSCVPNPVSVSNKKADEVFLVVPPIDTICKANGPEKCCSYDSCVCGNSCLISNLKKRLIEMEIVDNPLQQDCINTAIKKSLSRHWLSTLEEQVFVDQKWISDIQSKTTNEDWLSKQIITCNTKETSQKRYILLPSTLTDGDSSLWLKEVAFENNLEKVDRSKEKSSKYPNNKFENSWLSDNNRKSIDKVSSPGGYSIKACFDRYLKSFDNESWLCNSSNVCVKDRSG